MSDMLSWLTRKHDWMVIMMLGIDGDRGWMKTKKIEWYIIITERKRGYNGYSYYVSIIQFPIILF